MFGKHISIRFENRSVDGSVLIELEWPTGIIQTWKLRNNLERKYKLFVAFTISIFSGILINILFSIPLHITHNDYKLYDLLITQNTFSSLISIHFTMIATLHITQDCTNSRPELSSLENDDTCVYILRIRMC